MKTSALHALLLAGAVGISLPTVHAFDESPAFPEWPRQGAQGRQRALPEHFSSIAGAAWGDDKSPLSDKATEMVKASRAGLIESVKSLLAEGVLPNAPDELGQRPLPAAVAEGHGEVVRMLLARGADPNAKGAQGRVPLEMAAAAGNLGMVRMLLRAGAEVDARSDHRATALHEAVRFDHPETVRALLAANPNPARYDREGLHPLALAAARGRLSCLKMILDAGVAPDLPDRNGLTALYWARRHDHVLAESLLVEHGAGREAWAVWVD